MRRNWALLGSRTPNPTTEARLCARATVLRPWDRVLSNPVSSLHNDEIPLTLAAPDPLRVLRTHGRPRTHPRSPLVFPEQPVRSRRTVGCFQSRGPVLLRR